MIKAIDVSEIPAMHESEVVRDLRYFIKSALDACEVETNNVNNTQSAYYAAIKRYDFPVRVLRRNGRVFLIKEGIDA